VNWPGRFGRLEFTSEGVRRQSSLWGPLVDRRSCRKRDVIAESLSH
jgi:hypothetical protein